MTALALFGVSRAASSQPNGGELPGEARARLARAQDALRAGNSKQAADIARPLFDAYPDDYGLQDLRCQCAIFRYLPREEIEAQCANIKRLAASGVSPSPPGPSEPSPPKPASPPPPAPSPPATPPESEPTEAAADDEPPPSQSASPASEPPPQPAVNARDTTARRYRGLGWSIRPGVLFGRGTAGLSLEGRLEYGFDTGGVIVMPGASLAGYFAHANTYVEMATMKLVFPVGCVALFVEGGAGVGQISHPEQAAPALMGAGGFAVHPGPSLMLGLEAGYEALLGTDFQVVLVGPVFSVRF